MILQALLDFYHSLHRHHWWFDTIESTPTSKVENWIYLYTCDCGEKRRITGSKDWPTD
jgi:hypothetical protein